MLGEVPAGGGVMMSGERIDVGIEAVQGAWSDA